ncbi:MAG: Calx-beta domain-containing protein, partial [Acidimicrobiia bacterium]
TASCSIDAVGFSNDGVLLVADASIGFDDSVAPPQLPVVTVTPNAGLPYRAQVAVHATGFSPGESVFADFCVNGPESGECASYAQATADATGTVDLTLGVKRRVYFGGAGSVDCIDATVECTVQVQGEHGYERTQTVVTFDPNAPIPPPPTASVTPDHNLGYRQAVSVVGSGFTPGSISVEQCGRLAPGDPTSFEFCAGYTQLEADAVGAVTGMVQVRRLLSFGPPGAPSIDCATTPEPCTLRIGSGDPDESAVVPLAFDPNSQPPPPPVVTLSPAVHLRDGQNMTVKGVGFTGGSTMGLAPCKAGVTAIADACDIGRASVATADANGMFSATRPAVGVIQTAEGPFDCTTAPGACVIAVANAADLSEFAFAPMSFDVPDLELHSATVTEGTGTTTMAEVRVELSAPIGSPTTVEWLAFPSSATPDDYVQARGRVTIPAGATEAMIHIGIVGDAIDEPTERFIVAVSSAPGTHVTEGDVTVKIRDDDAPPSVSIHDGDGREGSGWAQAEITLSAPSGKPIVVHYVTHHRTARSRTDYVRTDSEIRLAPGETHATIHIPLVDDHVREPTETFRIVLDDAENADVARAEGIVTIRDDD